MRDDFAVFILSHGRADRVYTLKTLLDVGQYSGKWYIIIDSEDKTCDDYIALAGNEHVIVFDKSKVELDTMDNFFGTRGVVFARNECWDIAKNLGISYFLVLDDDYTSFAYRYIKFEKKRAILAAKTVKNMDALFNAMIEFLDTSGAITIAFAQAGDFIGGINNNFLSGLLRKAMNSFFCKTDTPFKFPGRINEDVNMYVYENSRGKKIFTVVDIALVQLQTQKNAGGLTELYLDAGTYVKSFYSVMIAPSCVKVALMGESARRLHHSVDWNACAPKILSDKYKKG